MNQVTAVRLPLDEAGHHRLCFERQGEEWIVLLEHDRGQRRSPLHEALLKRLQARHARGTSWLDPQTDRLTVPRGDFTLDLGDDPKIILAEVQNDQPRSRYRLSPFECRYLADNERPHPPAPAATGPQLRTDLHSHFAGCVRAETLVEIGAAAGLDYPCSILAELGIYLESPQVPLEALSPSWRRALAEALALPEDRQSTFVAMQAVYRRRAPITKARSALLPLCRQIARDYAAMGVEYAELSLFDVLRAEVLQALHDGLPAIEAETGVRLRFLAAFSRHDDFEWDLDLLDRLETILESGYLVGVDVMGHETNSTNAFAEVLRRFGRLAARARPGLVVRVHAGENPAFPENVRVAAECLAGEPVELRIGHGLYGVDDEALRRLRDQGVIVEFNLNSNFALNNIQSSLEVPLLRYLEAGVPVVLGTDGYGIYGTSLPLELRAARLSGLDAAGLEAIARTEAELLARRGREVAPFAVPEDPPPNYYGPQVAERKRQQAELKVAAWQERQRALELPMLRLPELDQLAEHKQVLVIAGAWKHSYRRWSPARVAEIEALVEALLKGLDPEQTLLLTGGTRHGLEGLVHRRAASLGLTVVGAVVRDLLPSEVDGVGLSHLCLIADTLYQKAAALYAFVDRHDGLAIFIGGGPIVSDEIQTAANLRLRYLLMDGPEGASTDQARHRPSRAFRSAEQVLAAFHDPHSRRGHRAPYWHLGPNPTVDLVILRVHPVTERREVLLIQRDFDAASEPGKWALPGGFQQTAAERGTPWVPGLEGARTAAVRELREETGLDLSPLLEALQPLGVYEGPGRDLRDTKEAWSRSEVYGLALTPELARCPLAAGDDATDVAWFPLDALPKRLAFDHAQILHDVVPML